MHDAASAWNAGFIRQVCNRRVLLPDKSGVPVVVSRCARLQPPAGLPFASEPAMMSAHETQFIF
jgi:hypothetical protein